MANDHDLGLSVQGWLAKIGLESPLKDPQPVHGMTIPETIKDAWQRIIDALGLDHLDDSIKDTPKRMTRMYCEEIFRGLDYANFPSCSTFPNNMKADEMVAVKDIEVKSVCEHHFMPFMGTAVCGYIPKDKLLGLSKFNRIVDFFARRPQVQERLTEQISATLQFILETEDVAVYIKAKHLCTSFRGVEDFLSATVTSKLSGRFRSVSELRTEFLSLTK